MSRAERISHVHGIFEAFDYDNSGTIDANEFLCIGRAVNDSFDAAKSEKAFARVDKDKSGGIDANEFVRFFESNGVLDRTQEAFDKLIARYTQAAIDGRAAFYENHSSAAVDSAAPESYKVKAEALAHTEALERSRTFVEKHAARSKRKGMCDRAAQYIKEYAGEERALVRQRRQAKANGNYFAEPEPKLMFVIRIRGMCDMHPKTKKILQLLRLRQIHLGVFLRVNKATLEMIKRVEPYIAYGYPSLKATRSLIYKRGFGKQRTTGQPQRVALTSNDVIEAQLGGFGISCFEDLIHEIYTVGPHFKEANNFLWAFKLNSPKGGLAKKRLGFNEGGQCGNREQYISALIARML